MFSEVVVVMVMVVIDNSFLSSSESCFGSA
jgi:hypothetical protein